MILDASMVHSNGIYRLRLELSSKGALSLVVNEFAEDSMLKFATFSQETIDPNDYLLRHKTTARHMYDRELRKIAKRHDIFDTIFTNTRGEVCEGARSNIFIRKHGALITPPLACGLLPGVMRQYLLQSKQATEQIIHVEDLLLADELFMANALRGLVPVSLLEDIGSTVSSKSPL